MQNKKKNIDEIIKKSEDIDPILFCKECAEIGLEDFGLDPSDKTALERAKEQHKICKEIGRFKGEMCARIFIASDELPDFNDEDDPLEEFQ